MVKIDYRLTRWCDKKEDLEFVTTQLDKDRSIKYEVIYHGMRGYAVYRDMPKLKKKHYWDKSEEE